MSWQLLVVLGGAGLVFVLGVVIMVAVSYRRVEQGKALIVNGLKHEPTVSFTGSIVYPILQRAEVLDLSVKRIVLDHAGARGLICKDNIRADLRAVFFMRVNKTTEDVLRVAQSVGCERAARQETLVELFAAKLSDALSTVARQLEFEELVSQRELFRDQVIEVIGRDLNGFVLEDLAIERLEQTPLEALDPQNILDAQGIRKLLEVSARQGQAVSNLVLQRFHEAQVAVASAAGRAERPAKEQASSRPAGQGSYRDARAAAEAQVQVLEQELERARQTLAAYDRKDG